ncbi:MAG: hypothetical protein WKG01_26140 [Kofleriaceae bacterium]
MRRALLTTLLASCSSTNSAQPPVVTTAHTVRPVTPVAAPVPASVGDLATPGRVISAHVAIAVGDTVPTDRPGYARADQEVTLYAAIVVAEGKTRLTYSDAKVLRLGGTLVTPQPLARAPRVDLRWNRIEPALATMTNGDTPAEFRFEPIDYRVTAIDGAAGKPAITADVRPTLTPDHGHGVGTMRFQLVALQGDRMIASAGPEARRGKGSGGLTDAVARVSIRRDDSYLGFLTEMYGQPYVWASAGLSDNQHQSEHLEGSDCADFVVYGARRMGKKLAYTWTGALPQVSKLLAAGSRGAGGAYRAKDGTPLPFTRVGDLVLFPRHVGVLAADRGQLGVLDDQDLMMHTLFDTPKEQAIADSTYADQPLELRRLR